VVGAEKVAILAARKLQLPSIFNDLTERQTCKARKCCSNNCLEQLYGSSAADQQAFAAKVSSRV
jgi:hypothetical protein